SSWRGRRLSSSARTESRPSLLVTSTADAPLPWSSAVLASFSSSHEVRDPVPPGSSLSRGMDAAAWSPRGDRSRVSESVVQAVQAEGEGGGNAGGPRNRGPHSTIDVFITPLVRGPNDFSPDTVA